MNHAKADKTSKQKQQWIHGHAAVVRCVWFPRTSNGGVRLVPLWIFRFLAGSPLPCPAHSGQRMFHVWHFWYICIENLLTGIMCIVLFFVLSIVGVVECWTMYVGMCLCGFRLYWDRNCTHGWGGFFLECHVSDCNGSMVCSYLSFGH